MSIPFCLCIHSDDPSLGKIDKHSLFQETLMDLLIEGITNKQVICGDLDETRKISEWVGVSFNESSEIAKIRFSGMELEGSVELQWLPATITSFSISGNAMSGTIDLTCLPVKLTYLDLSVNSFQGTVDLTQLPFGMTDLFMQGNRFHGKTDFSQLRSRFNRSTLLTQIWRARFLLLMVMVWCLQNPK